LKIIAEFILSEIYFEKLAANLEPQELQKETRTTPKIGKRVNSTKKKIKLENLLITQQILG